MWELSSGKPPFSDHCHDLGLALSIIDGLRPEIVEGTPKFYSKIMEQCWNADPENRIQPSLLPKIFEEMLDLCFIDNTKINIMQVPILPVISTMGKEKEVESGKLDFSESENSILAFTEIFEEMLDSEIKIMQASTLPEISKQSAMEKEEEIEHSKLDCNLR